MEHSRYAALHTYRHMKNGGWWLGGSEVLTSATPH